MRIKGWEKFQHFKDRRPPWIKLYRDLLDDPEWFALDPLAAKNLVMLWLIASEDFGTLPATSRLCFRLRISEKQLSSTISQLSHWLIQDDVNVISGRYQDDAPETETYKEETETDNPPSPLSGGGLPDSSKSPKSKKRDEWFILPANISPDVWAAFEANRKAIKVPLTARARKQVVDRAISYGDPDARLLEAVEKGWRTVYPPKDAGGNVIPPKAPKVCSLPGCGKPGRQIVDGRHWCSFGHYDEASG